MHNAKYVYRPHFHAPISLLNWFLCAAGICWFRYDTNTWIPDQQSALCTEWAAERFWNADYASLDLALRLCQSQLMHRHPREVDDAELEGAEMEGWDALMRTFGATFGVAWVRR